MDQERSIKYTEMLKMLLNICILLAQIPTTDAANIASGWIGVGLLGPVLAWLLWVHLPAKDKQIKDLLEVQDKNTREFLESANVERSNLVQLHSKERETDRTARHEVANMFQVAIANATQNYSNTIEKIENQHRLDAQADRDAFLQRNKAVEEAIRQQTSELKTQLGLAIQGSCRWFTHLEDMYRTNNPKDPKPHQTK